MAKEITDKTFSEETDKGLVLIDFGNLVWSMSDASADIGTISE